MGIIEVEINLGSHELARIRMTNLASSTDPSYGDYSIEIAVDRGIEQAFYQRSVYNFPRKEYNVLGLLKIALETLSEKELTLDADPDSSEVPSNLARRLPRTLF